MGGGGALIYSVKQQRLLLAQDEYQNLSDTLTGWKSSRTSCKYKFCLGDVVGWGALIYSVKQQRLLLAQDEYQNLSDTLSLSPTGNLLEQAVSSSFPWEVVGWGGSDILCKATEVIDGSG